MLDKVCYYFDMLSLRQKCLLDRILFINCHRRMPCPCCWNLFLPVSYLTFLLVALSDASRFVSIVLCYIYFCLCYLKKKEGLVHAMQSNGPQNKSIQRADYSPFLFTADCRVGSPASALLLVHEITEKRGYWEIITIATFVDSMKLGINRLLFRIRPVHMRA